MTYVWTEIGSIAQQEKLMRHACMLGPWTLSIVEDGWAEDRPIWKCAVYRWNDVEAGYYLEYTPKFRYSALESAKRHLEDWYACNVLLERLVMEVV